MPLGFMSQGLGFAQVPYAQVAFVGELSGDVLLFADAADRFEVAPFACDDRAACPVPVRCEVRQSCHLCDRGLRLRDRVAGGRQDLCAACGDEVQALPDASWSVVAALVVSADGVVGFHPGLCRRDDCVGGVDDVAA